MSHKRSYRHHTSHNRRKGKRDNLFDAESLRLRGDSYRFSLVDGKVTNLEEYDDGRWKTERIDRDESWTFDGTSLIKTEKDDGRVKTRTYVDVDGDGVFTRTGPDLVTGINAGSDNSHPSGISGKFRGDSYRFSLVDGKVTNLEEYDDGRWKTERIDRDESWTFDGTSLIKTEKDDGRVKTRTYVDPDGDGVFLKATKLFDPIFAAPNTDIF